MQIQEFKVVDDGSEQYLFNGVILLAHDREFKNCKRDYMISLLFKFLLVVSIVNVVNAVFSNDYIAGIMNYANIALCLYWIMRDQEVADKWVAYRNLMKYRTF